MLERKYDKRLSNLWQNFFENSNVYGNIDFSL